MLRGLFVEFTSAECWGAVVCKDIQQIVWRTLLNDPALRRLRTCARRECFDHGCTVGHCILLHYEPVPVLCDAAFRWDVSTIEYIPFEYITIDMMFTAVKHDGLLLRFITLQMPYLCECAVRNNPMALQYVREQTPELCELAVQLNGLALEHVRNYTEHLGNLAVAQDGLALQFIARQTEQQCRVAVRRNVNAVRFCKIHLR